MLRDLKDAWGWISKIIRRIERLESGALLERSSITEGRMRFIGGLLRVDSGGRVEIVGTLEIDGTTTVTGTFHVNGPWQIAGDGTITGATTVTGQMTVNGPWTMNGLGKITGNVDLTGSMTVKAGGAVTVEGQNPIIFDQNGGVARMRMGASEVRGGDGIGLYPANGPAIISTSAGLRIFPLPTISRASANNAVVGSLWQDSNGFVYRVV